MGDTVARGQSGPDVTSRQGPLAALREEEAEAGVVPRLQAVVEAQPDAVAVADARRRITFAELAAGAALVRGRVLAAAAPGEPVAVLHSHDAGAVVVALGVLASGHPLVMLDPRTPVPRLAELARRAGATTVLADAEFADAAAAAVPHVVAVPGPPTGGAARRPDAVAALAAMWAAPPDPEDPAVLAFTSGTTGNPKIVVNDHRMLVHDAWSNAIATGAFGAGDVVGHSLPLAFHAGLMAVVAGAVVGARLEVYDVRASGVGGLAPWLHEVGAAFTALSPAIARALVASSPDPTLLSTLRAVSLAGEALHGVDARKLLALLPAECVLLNRYGSSETGLITTSPVRQGDPIPDGPLPVGPVAGLGVISIRAEDGSSLPDGEPGTVTVTRCHLASGYWNDAEATAQAFTHHADGTTTFRSKDVGRWDATGLTLLGRRDHSVKIRGYLVEPGEVDAALFALPDVREAVTVGVPDGNGYRLVAYVVPDADKPSAAGIRTGLRQVLPGHMVPATVVFVDALPRTERGKIDRAALPPPPPPITGPGPQTVWEGVIAEAWTWVLELEHIPRDADFFELGGDSLAAEALISLITGQLGVPAEGVTPALLVEAPTLAEFAKRLHRRPDRRHPTLTTLRESGSKPPLWLIAGGGALGVGFVPLTRQLDADQPVFGLHSHGLEQRAVPDWSVQSAARRHLMVLRQLQRRGPYFIGGHSFGGILAYEMARQLRDHGHEVGLLIAFDSFPPDPSVLPPPPQKSLVGKLKGAVGLAVTGLVPTPGVGQYWRFHTQSQFLSRRYSAPPYAGPTLVVVAESGESEARAQWDRHLTGPWRMATVPGDHNSFLRDPYVTRTGEIVVEALAQAREGRFATPAPAPSGPSAGSAPGSSSGPAVVTLPGATSARPGVGTA